MPRARITFQTEFSAAVRLFQPRFSESRNREVFGVCYSPNSHGHTWLMEVTVEGPVDVDSGMVMNFHQLQELVVRKVIQKVDHKNLNLDVGFLKDLVPTTENLAVRFWEILAAALPEGVGMAELRLSESRDFGVVYHGPQEDGT